MALKNLTTEEMLQISGTWTNSSSPAYAAVQKVPELAARSPRLSDVHGTLAAAAQPTEEGQLAQIIAEEGKLDIRHDTIIRGVYGYLTATAELIGGKEGEARISLRDKLVPDGLTSQQKTYRAQAGQAAQLSARLTTEVAAQTDAMIVTGNGAGAKTLTSYLHEWVEIGEALGALEDKRGALVAAQASVGGATEVKARNQWIRLVNAFVADGELAELDEAASALIFGPLKDAEKKAAMRGRAAATKGNPGETEGAAPAGG